MLNMPLTQLKQFAAVNCDAPSFFAIPSWSKYLPVNLEDGICKVKVEFIDPSTHVLKLDSLLLVGLGILDILLRVAALVAVGFIVYAGVQYVTAQGEPEKSKHALGTIINALIGLGITIVAAAAVSFVGHRFGSS